MSLAEFAESLPPEILRAFEQKGYSSLTSVQQVVLDPALAGRDLRMTSQTGSGKTVAIGLALRALPLSDAAAQSGIARPRALVITPTRELAQQVEQELAWLYAELGVRVACVTGGSAYRNEQRAFARGPGIVVGTPGRLLDHLRRGAIDPSQVAALIMDEADRMLDLGFREDLLAIIELMPTERVTHMVSATFPRALSSLADRVQRDPAHVQGTSLGAANADIDHVIHVVDAAERGAAIINLLLAHPEEQTLVFVRTRADAAELSSLLSRSGFAASGLSGEMEQAARNRALSLFREGELRVLVATDVAARGIDVQSVTLVLHAEPPTDPDAYTHRSGRTGRAGRKGVSALLLSPSRVVQATRLLRGLGVPHRFEPVPTPEQIMLAQDERLFLQLTAAEAAPPDADATPEQQPGADETANAQAVEPRVDADGERKRRDAAKAERGARTSAAPRSNADGELDDRFINLAQRLVEHGSVERVLALLLARTYSAVRPRRVRAFPQSLMRERERGRSRDDRSRRSRDDSPFDRSQRPREARSYESPRRSRDGYGSEGRSDGARVSRDSNSSEPARHPRERDAGASGDQARHPRERDAAASGGAPREFVMFRVTWGEQDGADARRVLAMICRRGDIRGTDVGPIRIDQHNTLVGVDSTVADDFEHAAGRSDKREPHIQIRRDGRGAPDRSPKPPPGAAREPKRAPSFPHAKLNKNKGKPFKAKSGKPPAAKPPARRKHIG